MDQDFKLQKRAGKAVYSGRRRTATRRSGFVSHEAATGGKIRTEAADVYLLAASTPLALTFEIPEPVDGGFRGFGFYFRSSADVRLHSDAPWFSGKTYTQYANGSWNKCGALWLSDGPSSFSIFIEADAAAELELFSVDFGEIWHEYFESARPELMRNLSQFAPEANFYVYSGEVVVSQLPVRQVDTMPVKECNRCARFLPVNLSNERDTLSFSNHCIARRPCTHKGFGRLVDLDKQAEIKLEYGFQLECRVCKKFVVNGALNPQRTADQMKEDAQRRRHFELLISELNGKSSQMAFRHATGVELSTFVWERFEKKCFKCKVDLPTVNSMHLDHTRPLALLWPLDATATALCDHCNSAKRDRQPADFYTATELQKLSQITEIPLSELADPTPNVSVLLVLRQNVDWLIHDFLNKEYLTTEKDGKISAELICKALDRVLRVSKLDWGDFSFVGLWNTHFLR